MKTQHLSTEALIDYIHGALAPEADAGVFQHLASCAACRAEYESEVGLGEALRASARAQEVEFPSIVAARVWEEIRNARPGPFAGLAALLRPVIAVPLAVAILLGGYFATPLGRPGAPQRTIDATYYLEQHAGQAESDPLSERGSAQTIESSLVSEAELPASLAAQAPAPLFGDALDGAH